MPSLVFAPTPKDLVLRVAEGCRAVRSEQPVREDWREELGLLCSHYREVIVLWFRSRGLRPQDAEDLAGDFIHRWMSGSPLGNYVPGAVPFRRFLSRCLSNFLCEHLESQRALKRGGRCQDAKDLDQEHPAPPAPWLPEDDVALARAVQSRAIQSVHERFQDDERWMALLGVALGGSPFVPGDSYVELAQRTGLTPGAVKVRVHRIREAFWKSFESEVRAMCGPGVPAHEEVAALAEALVHATRHSP